MAWHLKWLHKISLFPFSSLCNLLFSSVANIQMASAVSLRHFLKNPALTCSQHTPASMWQGYCPWVCHACPEGPVLSSAFSDLPGET
jgi:hypothetical protein